MFGRERDEDERHEDLRTLSALLQRFVEPDISDEALAKALMETRKIIKRFHPPRANREWRPSDIVARIIYAPVDPNAGEECTKCERYVRVMRDKET